MGDRMEGKGGCVFCTKKKENKNRREKKKKKKEPWKPKVVQIPPQQQAPQLCACGHGCRTRAQHASEESLQQKTTVVTIVPVTQLCYRTEAPECASVQTFPSEAPDRYAGVRRVEQPLAAQTDERRGEMGLTAPSANRLWTVQHTEQTDMCGRQTGRDHS